MPILYHTSVLLKAGFSHPPSPESSASVAVTLDSSFHALVFWNWTLIINLPACLSVSYPAFLQQNNSRTLALLAMLTTPTLSFLWSPEADTDFQT